MTKPRRIKLTQDFFDNAVCEQGKPYTRFYDQSLKRFGFIVRDSGRKSFFIQYRHHGDDRRMTIDGVLTVKAARDKARKLLGKVASKQDPLEEAREQRRKQAGANTVKALCEEYLKRECGMKRDADGNAAFPDDGKLRTADERRAVLERHIYPRLGSLDYRHVKRSDIVRTLDEIEDASGRSMAHHALAYLRRVFTWQESRSDDFRSPIVRGMARKGSSRERALSDDELRAVWRTAESFPGVYGYYLRFLLLTATRRNEASDMARQELDNGDWVIPGPRCKGGRDHVVPLSKAAKEILAGIKPLGPYVFSFDGVRPIGGFSKFKRQFDTAVLEALRKDDPQAKPLANWTQHDLRRTARSLLSRAGVDADIAERCLGHVIGGVRGVYDRYQYRDEKARAFEVLAAEIKRVADVQANAQGRRRKTSKKEATPLAATA